MRLNPWRSKENPQLNQKSTIKIEVRNDDEEQLAELSERFQDRVENELISFKDKFDAFTIESLQNENEILLDDIRLINDELNIITDEWGVICKRYESGEATDKLLFDLQACDAKFKQLSEIKTEEFKRKKQARIEKIKENENWREQAEKALNSSDAIEDFQGTQQEFEEKFKKDATKKGIEEDFVFDIRSVLKDFLKLSDDEILQQSDGEWEKWRKVCASIKMENSLHMPKRLVVFGGKTYCVDVEKQPSKKYEKEEVREARNKFIGIFKEKIKNRFNKKDDEITNIYNLRFRDSDYKYIVSLIMKAEIADFRNLQTVIEEGVDSPALDDVKSKFDEKLQNNLSEFTQLIVKVFIKNQIGAILANIKKSAGYDLEDELVEEFYANLDDENKENIAEFNAKKENSDGGKYAMNKDKREKIEKDIKKFVLEKFPPDSTVATAGTEDITNADDANKTEDAAKVKVEKASKKPDTQEQKDDKKKNDDGEKKSEKAKEGKVENSESKSEAKEEQKKNETPAEIYERFGATVKFVLERRLKERYKEYLEVVKDGEISVEEADKHILEEIVVVLERFAKKNAREVATHILGVIKNSVK